MYLQNIAAKVVALYFVFRRSHTEILAQILAVLSYSWFSALSLWVCDRTVLESGQNQLPSTCALKAYTRTNFYHQHMAAMLFCLVWQKNAVYLLVYTKEDIKIKIPLWECHLNTDASADIMPFKDIFKGKLYVTFLFVRE